MRTISSQKFCTVSIAWPNRIDQRCPEPTHCRKLSALHPVRYQDNVPVRVWSRYQTVIRNRDRRRTDERCNMVPVMQLCTAPVAAGRLLQRMTLICGPDGGSRAPLPLLPRASTRHDFSKTALKLRLTKKAAPRDCEQHRSAAASSDPLTSGHRQDAPGIRVFRFVECSKSLQSSDRPGSRSCLWY